MKHEEKIDEILSSLKQNITLLENFSSEIVANAVRIGQLEVKATYFSDHIKESSLLVKQVLPDLAAIKEEVEQLQLMAKEQRELRIIAYKNKRAIAAALITAMISIIAQALTKLLGK